VWPAVLSAMMCSLCLVSGLGIEGHRLRIGVGGDGFVGVEVGDQLVELGRQVDEVAAQGLEERGNFTRGAGIQTGHVDALRDGFGLGHGLLRLGLEPNPPGGRATRRARGYRSLTPASTTAIQPSFSSMLFM